MEIYSQGLCYKSFSSVLSLTQWLLGELKDACVKWSIISDDVSADKLYLWGHLQLELVPGLFYFIVSE